MVRQTSFVDPLHTLIATQLRQLTAGSVQRHREVDQVNMLVRRVAGDVLHLDALGSDELSRRILGNDVDPGPADQLDLQPGLFPGFPEGCIIGEFVELDMTTGRQPETQFAVRVQ